MVDEHDKMGDGGVSMIATMESMQLLDEADAIVQMISDSTLVEQYKESKERLQDDLEAQALIQEFVDMKEIYNEVQRFGRYHPDYKTVIKDMMELKRKLDLNETINSYKQAEEALEELLNEISQMIAQSVSPSIKVPTGNPFFDKGCSGGCGSGGACGCG